MLVKQHRSLNMGTLVRLLHMATLHSLLNMATLLRLLNMATLLSLLNMVTLVRLLNIVTLVRLLHMATLLSLLNMATLVRLLHVVTLVRLLNMVTLVRLLNMATLLSLLHMATTLRLLHMVTLVKLLNMATPVEPLNMGTQARPLNMLRRAFTSLWPLPRQLFLRQVRICVECSSARTRRACHMPCPFVIFGRPADPRSRPPIRCVLLQVQEVPVALYLKSNLKIDDHEVQLLLSKLRGLGVKTAEVGKQRTAVMFSANRTDQSQALSQPVEGSDTLFCRTSEIFNPKMSKF